MRITCSSARSTRAGNSLPSGILLLGALLITLGWPTASHAADIVEYYHLDAIGNVRLITDQNGNAIERHDYYPFGEECTTGACASNPGVGAGQARKFTGKERDTETGLDYFGARYYGAKIGRFTTVDPVYTWNDNLLDPQRWNRYSYGRNNPLRYVDPDGRATLPANTPGAPRKPAPGAGALAWIAYTIDVAFFGPDPAMAVMPIGPAGKAVEATELALATAKRGPKPKGVGPHNITIERRIGELKAEGMEHIGGDLLPKRSFRLPVAANRVAGLT